MNSVAITIDAINPNPCSKKPLQGPLWDFGSRIPSLSPFCSHRGTIPGSGVQGCSWGEAPGGRFAFPEPVTLGYNHTQISCGDSLTNCWEGAGAMESFSRNCGLTCQGLLKYSRGFRFYFLSKCVLHLFKDSKVNKLKSA